jgi:hypothetical protein
MIDCPDLIAELDRLTAAVRSADTAIWERIHGKTRGTLRSLQALRDKAEGHLFKFCREHGVQACMSLHYRYDL